MAVRGKQPSREYVRTNRIEQRTHAKVLTKEGAQEERDGGGQGRAARAVGPVEGILAV